MSNNLNLTDSVNEALFTGKNATFTYNGTTYTFSPQGLIDFLVAEGGFGASGNITVDSLTITNDQASIDANGDIQAEDIILTGTIAAVGATISNEATINASVVSMGSLPTADPGEAGRLWIDTANGRVIKVSAG